MKYWDRKEKLFKYTEGVRQFFPLAEEQLQVISRIIDHFNPRMRTFLDLGCGDGFLGYFIYRLYPESSGVFMDISAEMIQKARARDSNHPSEFITMDFGKPEWHESIESIAKFDLVISGYSIHHIRNREKKRLYADIFRLLNPGGIFLNLDHVSSPTESIGEIFSELFLDGMSDYHDSINDGKSPEELKSLYQDPEHKKLNRLESVELQCGWLREIGFSDVDCYMKILELALFGGTKS